MEATLQTIQDIVTVEDFDVSDCFQYSNSMESVKSTVSETFMSKPSIAKRRANQQETEQFYFTVRALFGLIRTSVDTDAHRSFGIKSFCQLSEKQALNAQDLSLAYLDTTLTLKAKTSTSSMCLLGPSKKGMLLKKSLRKKSGKLLTS
jgi:hypothetical protein